MKALALPLPSWLGHGKTDAHHLGCMNPFPRRDNLRELCLASDQPLAWEKTLSPLLDPGLCLYPSYPYHPFPQFLPPLEWAEWLSALPWPLGLEILLMHVPTLSLQPRPLMHVLSFPKSQS